LRFELLWQLDFVPWALWLLVLGLWSAQLREVTQRPAVWLSCALLWCGVPTAATLPDLAPPLLAVVGSIALLESLHRLAFQDELTGAASRRALDDALRAVPSQYALALVDVDHFKKINDRHGHAAGDQVLRAVAARLRETRGAELFRYGGEEFALLFRRRSLDEALQAVDAARQRIARHAFVVRAPQRPVGGKRHRNRHGSGGAERTIRVRVSAGVAQGAAASAESTIGAADKALYRAKRAGRNRVLRAPVPRKS
jgi:GGDEF domain-containing protein